jgi:hypothetical protein
MAAKATKAAKATTLDDLVAAGVDELAALLRAPIDEAKLRRAGLLLDQAWQRLRDDGGRRGLARELGEVIGDAELGQAVIVAANQLASSGRWRGVNNAYTRILALTLADGG